MKKSCKLKRNNQRLIDNCEAMLEESVDHCYKAYIKAKNALEDWRKDKIKTTSILEASCKCKECSEECKELVEDKHIDFIGTVGEILYDDATYKDKVIELYGLYDNFIDNKGEG